MNEEKLRELYFEKEWSGKRISKEYDISAHYYPKKYDIETKSASEKVEIPKDDLKELYFDKNLSLKNIGDRFGCCGSTVKRRMEEYGLETRSPTDSYDIDENKLYNLYYKEEKSLNEVAKFFDVSVGVITNRMDRNDWERRGSQPLKSMKGKNNPFYGKSHTEETKQKISEANKGNTWEEMFDEETLKKQREHVKNLKYWEGKERPGFGEKYSGENHWHHGKNFDEEHRRKIRKSLADHYRNKEGQSYPNYNPKACKIIDEYGEKHGYDFQHAENEGEHYIENIGCWVDGYDEEANVVVEVYEKHCHYRAGNLKDKDKLREKLIIEELDCKFIRISLNRNREISQIKEIS